jgi:metal-sulfur cluster biosynthetic enzyme
VEMTTTTRGCPATAYLKEAVQSAAWSVPGIHYAEVKLTYEPSWSPGMMKDAARSRLHLA